MRADVPWFNPVKGVWHVFNADENGMVTGEPIQSFLTVEESIAYLKGGNQETIKKNETSEQNNSKEEKKKVVKKGTTYEDMQKETVQISDIQDTLLDPKTWEGNVGGDNPYKKNELATDFDETQKIVYQRAKGGRVGAAEGYSPLGVTIPEPDKDATELEELNAWWKSQLKSKDITDEG